MQITAVCITCRLPFRATSDSSKGHHRWLAGPNPPYSIVESPRSAPYCSIPLREPKRNPRRAETAELGFRPALTDSTQNQGG
jgi:hypothetical protein